MINNPTRVIVVLCLFLSDMTNPRSFVWRLRRSFPLERAKTSSKRGDSDDDKQRGVRHNFRSRLTNLRDVAFGTIFDRSSIF